MNDYVYHNWTNQLDEESKEYIASNLIKKRVGKNEFLYRKGELSEGIFFIFEGIVELSEIDINGVEVIYKQFSDKEWFGFVGELCHDHKRKSNAIAKTDSYVGFLSGSNLKRVLLKNPEIQFFLYTELTDYIEHLIEQYYQSVNYNLYERIEAMLRKLCEWRGSSELKLSQYELASYLGVSKEALGLQLQVMKRNNLIALGYKKITYLSYDKN
ncbi:Crp/Fnr family transcriptional regulator [Aliivibrio fischeri]|uniref:Crp/Fnr family transcriptional regulator n=1 Tax=Aliivibrio fischeri TaxID=668 RepID=UPI0007C4F300|nr:Crp/Fnr family transcriptional regulator [Aliivibrio fischeri]